MKFIYLESYELSNKIIKININLQMKSLANLSYLSSIKQICDKHPKLLYFICFWGTHGRFPIRNIIDCQEDCKILSKLGITDYDPPYERVTHSITYQSCSLTFLGEDILEDLINESICEELKRIIDNINEPENVVKNDHSNPDESESNKFVNQKDFEMKFYELFTFDLLEDDILDIEYNKVREEFSFIAIAPRRYRVEKDNCSFEIDCSIEDDVFYFLLNVRCKCSNSFEIKIKKDENCFKYWLPYKKECENCGIVFIISPDFYNLKLSSS